MRLASSDHLAICWRRARIGSGCGPAGAHARCCRPRRQRRSGRASRARPARRRAGRASPSWERWARATARFRCEGRHVGPGQRRVGQRAGVVRIEPAEAEGPQLLGHRVAPDRRPAGDGWRPRSAGCRSPPSGRGTAPRRRRRRRRPRLAGVTARVRATAPAGLAAVAPCEDGLQRGSVALLGRAGEPVGAAHGLGQGERGRGRPCARWPAPGAGAGARPSATPRRCPHASAVAGRRVDVEAAVDRGGARCPARPAPASVRRLIVTWRQAGSSGGSSVTWAKRARCHGGS